MKKRIITLCGVFIVCIIVIIEMVLLKTNEAKFNPVDHVTMDIVEGSLTNTGATIVITDLSGEDYTYGESFRIDKLENDKWYEIEDIIEGNFAWHMIGYSVDEDNKLVMDINWKWLYGSLDSGEYRIVKSVGNKHVAVEFTIE